MHATPAARKMARSSRGLTAHQGQHTLTIASAPNHLETGTGYQFVVDGSANISDDPSFGDFSTQIGPLTVVSGFVRGGSDQWNIDGRVLNFRVQAANSSAYVIRLDGEQIGANEVSSLTDGDTDTPDDVLSDHYGGSGGNGGNGDNGNGGNGDTPGVPELNTGGIAAVLGTVAIAWLTG